MPFDSPSWIIDATTIDAEVIRRALGTLMSSGGGIVTPGDLAVSAQATPNMSVAAAPGEIWVPGTKTATQGLYYGRNGGPITVPISASNPSNPRVDTIVVQVQDAAYGDAEKEMSIPAPIVGTPTSGVAAPPTTAAQAAAAGAGELPASSTAIAYVLVPAGATSITNADIANVAALTALNANLVGAIAPVVVAKANGTGTLASTVVATLPSGLYLLWCRATGTNIDHQLAVMISVSSGEGAATYSTLIDGAYNNEPVWSFSMPSPYGSGAYTPGSGPVNQGFVSGNNSGQLTLETSAGTAWEYVVTRINASVI